MTEKPEDEIRVEGVKEGDMDVVPEHGEPSPHHVPHGEEPTMTPSSEPSLKRGVPEDTLPYPCPVDGCGKSYDNFRSLQGHMLGAHKISLKKVKYNEWRTEEGIIPQPFKKETGWEAEGAEEPFPAALDELDNILKSFGVKRRVAVINSMKMRDPSNLEELMWAMNDCGVNNDHARRIIADYARWLGVKIPRAVVDRLKPHTEDQRDWGRDQFRTQRRDQFEGFKRGDNTADMIKALADFQRTMNPRDDGRNSEVAQLREEVSALRQNLAAERDKRLFGLIEGLHEEIQALKGKDGDALNLGITRLADIGDKYVGFLATGAMAGEEAPKRERGGASSVADILRDVDGGAFLEVE